MIDCLCIHLTRSGLSNAVLSFVRDCRPNEHVAAVVQHEQQLIHLAVSPLAHILRGASVSECVASDGCVFVCVEASVPCNVTSLLFKSRFDGSVGLPSSSLCMMTLLE